MNDAGFTTLDWLVVGGYFIFVLVVGVLASRRKEDTRGFFLAGRKAPLFLAALSLLATSLSAVTFIGGPSQAYAGDLTYLSANLGVLIATVVVAFVFIPAFYRANVTTVYELLEARLGSMARRDASAMFLVGRVFASGARLYVAALAVSMVLFGDIEPAHLIASIAMAASVAVVYTLVGGIRAVLWTDAAQVVVLVGAAIAAVVMITSRIPVSAGEVFDALAAPTAAEPGGAGGAGKLSVINTSLDPSVDFTLWTALFGFSLFNIAAFATDQDLAQRLLTCRSAARSAWSLVIAQLMGVAVVALFLVLGALLYVFYQRPDLMGAAAPAVAPDGSRQVFLSFILAETPAGARGLMMAGLFAAAMSSTDSAMNAMASAAVCDFYKPLVRGKSEAHYLRASRVAVLLAGVALASFGCLCVYLQQGSGETLLSFALGVMVYAYAGLLGVFLTAVLTKRGNAVTTLLALAAGFATVALLQFGVPRFTGGAVVISLGWRMLIATAISFAICASVPGRRPTIA